jgi:ABC-type transport system involved in multi-copper enzyme maturation permease subunit
MTFLPIVARELRVASRRRSTYWLRSGAAAAVIVLGIWLFLMLQRSPSRELAMSLFCVLTGVAIFTALFSGVRSTSDCLSEEKREGTLGLLFLTDLKGYDVVLGKLFATSLNAFYAILASLPMLGIPLLMGGITLGEFGRMSLVAINTLFFSLALGMCVSALSRSPQKAMAATLLVLLLVSAVLPATGSMLAALGKTTQVQPAFLLPSPGYAYYLALDSPFKTAAIYFWYSLMVTHGLAWFCLVLACLIVPRTWQDRPGATQTLRWRERWQLWAYGEAVERAAFRRRLLDSNAFFWLAARVRFKPAIVWGFFGLLACGWVWGLAKFRRDWLTEAMYVTTALLINLTLRCWFAGEATRPLAEERKAGTLELLLSTPLGVRDIVSGQRLALMRQFLGPVLTALFVECLFLLAILRENFSEGERSFTTSLWVAGMLMLVADLVALYWVGMWQGLTAKNPARAASGSLSRVLIVPWLLIALVMLLVVLASMSGVREPDPSWKFFLGLWFVLGLLVDFGFGAYAFHKLQTEFRLAAQQRYEPRRGFWMRFSG